MKKKLILSIVAISITIVALSQENEIPDSGNVGIGTTDPTTKLDVRGSAKIDSTLIVNDSLKVTNYARVGEDLTVGGDAYFKSNVTVNNDLNVLGRSSLNQTSITGNLWLQGIEGLSSADGYELLLRESETGNIVRGGVESIGSILYSLECNSNNGIVESPTWSNGPNKIIVGCPEVSVGIGTIAPQKTLDVRGTGYFSSGVLAGNIIPTNYTNSALFEGIRSENATSPLVRLAVRKANGTNEVRFKVEGDGSVYCTSVKVRLSPTIPIPDFVFSPKYDLMPISEVKDYVTTFNHLPNIPSENEIREVGLSVEEMQLKLLQKVEELTLYMIQLNEKNEQLSRQNDELRKELEALKLQPQN